MRVIRDMGIITLTRAIIPTPIATPTIITPITLPRGATIMPLTGESISGEGAIFVALGDRGGAGISAAAAGPADTAKPCGGLHLLDKLWGMANIRRSGGIIPYGAR